MIYISTIFFILILPFFCNFSLIFYSDVKKAYFSLYLFGFIKIIGGYVEFDKKGIIIHYSNKKASFFSINISRKTNINIFSEFFVNKIILTFNIKSKVDFPLIYMTFFNMIMSDIIGKFYLKRKAKFASNIIIKEENFSEINLYLKLNFMFNFITLIKLFIKFLIGKIKNERTKQQNKYNY